MDDAVTAKNQGKAPGNVEVGDSLLDGGKNQICKTFVHIHILHGVIILVKAKTKEVSLKGHHVLIPARLVLVSAVNWFFGGE